MAYLYASVRGRKFEKALALNEGVQAALEAKAFEIGVRAEELLMAHRAEGIAHIELDEGDVDKYVILADSNTSNRPETPTESYANSAASIEFGRSAYAVTRKDKFGNEFEVQVGAMEGLFILTRASNLPKKRRPRVKVPSEKARRKP
ncbi:hypothetical protein AB0D63_20860 [Kitasatospora sp. NPDC048343]|uniref:hypothetical protein n=1 Tax=Kitasatospora sp. NPDC048343 TaxID=3154717 RepID=UPI0033C109EB